MRKLLIAVMTAALMALAAPAFAANTPGGTSDTGNQTNCGDGTQGTDVGQTGLTVGGVKAAVPNGDTNGALVVCNDGGTLGLPQAIQGRIILAGDAGTKSGYVAADGDADNPEQARGYARVDLSTAGPSVRCGDTTNFDTDAANPSGPGKACGA